jgi:hypothetical protein
VLTVQTIFHIGRIREAALTVLDVYLGATLESTRYSVLFACCQRTEIVSHELIRKRIRRGEAMIALGKSVAMCQACTRRSKANRQKSGVKVTVLEPHLPLVRSEEGLISQWPEWPKPPSALATTWEDHAWIRNRCG